MSKRYTFYKYRLFIGNSKFIKRWHQTTIRVEPKATFKQLMEQMMNYLLQYELWIFVGTIIKFMLRPFNRCDCMCQIYVIPLNVVQMHSWCVFVSFRRFSPAALSFSDCLCCFLHVQSALKLYLYSNLHRMRMFYELLLYLDLCSPFVRQTVPVALNCSLINCYANVCNAQQQTTMTMMTL